MTSGTFSAVLVSETRSEILKVIRVPAFLIPIIGFPAMFYALFGLLMFGGSGGAAGLQMPTYLLASYGTFGVVGAALFGMGVGVAVERGQGWLTLKSATPMPPLAYFGAKMLVSMIFGVIITLILCTLGTLFGGVSMSATTWLLLLLVLTVGAVPFCALGCALGYLAGPNSAPAIANMIYLPMSFLSGLWIPVEFMPKALQSVAVFMPPYHISRLALAAVGVKTNVLLHAGALVGFTAVFLALAVLAYRRDDGRTWG